MTVPLSKIKCLIALRWLLTLGACFYLGLGAWKAWQGLDGDLQHRYEEYVCFSKGIYPNFWVVPASQARENIYSVYPPYAFPLFGLFFGPCSLGLGRLMLHLGSGWALIVMGRYGARTLRGYGAEAAALGAVLAAAFAGNYSALRVGHFSIMCAALITLELVFLEKRKPWLAGLCWALAMIKPQIALPFALLFLIRGEWRSLLAGGAVLGALTAFCLWWTHLSPMAFLEIDASRNDLSFVTEKSSTAAVWMQACHIGPLVATGIALGILVSVGAFFSVSKLGLKVPLLPAAAVCAMLGFILFYHRHYDNIMLYPLVLAMVERLLRRGFKRLDVGLCLLLGGILYLPFNLLASLWPNANVFNFLSPLFASVSLFFYSPSSVRESSSEAGAAGKSRSR